MGPDFLFLFYVERSLLGELDISKQYGVLDGDSFLFLIGKNTLTLRPFHLLLFAWFLSSQHSISEMPAFALCFLLFVSKQTKLIWVPTR